MSMKLLQIVTTLVVAAVLTCSVYAEPSPVDNVDVATLEANAQAAIEEMGYDIDIDTVPGYGTALDFMLSGGLLSQVQNSCVSEPRIPDACVQELTNIPQLIQSLTTMNLTDIESLTSMINTKALCDACQTPDYPLDSKPILNAWAQSVLAEMNDPFSDPTCGGMAIPSINMESMEKMIEIGITAFCAKSEDDRYCWDSDMFAKAFLDAGFVEMATGIDPDNLMGSMSQLMVGLDSEKVCKAFEQTGCCGRTMMSLNPAILDLSCMNTPVIKTMLRVADGMCPNLAPACPITIPEYTATPQNECPSLSELISSVGELNRIADTPYNNCTNTKGVCPKNTCEMFMCRVTE